MGSCMQPVHRHSELLDSKYGAGLQFPDSKEVPGNRVTHQNIRSNIPTREPSQISGTMREHNVNSPQIATKETNVRNPLAPIEPNPVRNKTRHLFKKSADTFIECTLSIENSKSKSNIFTKSTKPDQEPLAPNLQVENSSNYLLLHQGILYKVPVLGSVNESSILKRRKPVADTWEEWSHGSPLIWTDIVRR